MASTKINLPDNSLLLSSSDYIHSLCQYLFEQLNFNHFSYGHYYDNGQTFRLMNDEGSGMGKKFLHSYYSEGLYANIEELQHLKSVFGNYQRLVGFKTPEISMADNVSHPTMRSKLCNQIELAKSSGVTHQISFGYRYKDYTSIIAFGSSSYATGFHNFCMQHLAVFRQFIEYFEQEAHSLLEKVKAQAISTLDTPQKSVFRTENFMGYDFLNKRQINLQLSPREIECLQKLTEGKSMKEAARVLSLSPRTVENYINNLKLKFNTQNTSQLLDTFLTLVYC